MAKFDIKTVKPKFVVTTSPENKIDVVVNKPIITSKNTKSFFKLKNTGGPKGEKGDQGDAATITVASTSTGAAGTDASVVNQGTAQDAQLAFTIPRGDKGEKGDTGARGFSPKAWVTRGDDYAQINIENEYSTSQARVYDGTDGQDGQDGQAATISVDSTTTLPAGSPATVENVGTSSAASLAFGIPQGVAGQDGADGADGFSPVATVTPTGTGATISITDAEGTTTADITNGVNGQDGDAATIQVGQVETLEPNQQAYVTNVGTSEAAIFNIGIPKGEKGESGSGSGDMLAADYDPSNTVKAAGGIPDYVSAQLPGDMTGATSSTAGAHGLVPAPAAGDQAKYLKGDGTWANTPAPELVEMSYGESNAWAKFIAAYTAHCIVYCRASSNANPATGSQTRKAFMAYVNNETSPTSVEFQYYRSVSSHSDSQQGDQVFVYTLTNASGGTWSVTTRNTFSKVVAGTNMTSSYSNGTLTLNATQPTVPTKTSDLTNDGSDGTSTYVEADELATVATTGAYSDLSGTPSLATVATSGDYDDLTNKPTIPAVNDATLTIQKNGTTVQTFTANQSTNATANIIVPTQFSDLSGTVSANQIDNRLFRMLVPVGTEITANANLNTIDYLSVGKYYCLNNTTVATMSNCPTTNAFMMEVFSPISTNIDDEETAAWCYRLRLITDYTGKMYMQRANTQGTAGTFTYFDWLPVNPDTTVNSYNVTSQAAHSGGNNSYILKKQLDHVTFAANIAWVNSITADTWTLLGVIPSAVRPSSALYCSGVAVKSNGALLGYCRIEIETNGNVNFKCSAANNALSGVGFNLSWFV